MVMATGEECLLMGGAWLPVTGTVNFLRSDVDAVVEMFVSVRGGVILKQTGTPVTVRGVRGSLAERFESLLPLVSAMASRYLFIPVVADDGEVWTAYVDNSYSGIEMGPALGLFAARGVFGVSICEKPNSYDHRTNLGSWGVRKVEVLEPAPDGSRDYAGYSLGVRVTDSSRWEFIEPVTGTPFPDPTDYGARRIPDRFTHGHLVQVAGFYGLRPFDEDFYSSQDRGVLVEDKGSHGRDWKHFTLTQAQENGRGVLWSHVEKGRVVELP